MQINSILRRKRLSVYSNVSFHVGFIFTYNRRVVFDNQLRAEHQPITCDYPARARLLCVLNYLGVSHGISNCNSQLTLNV